jgi:hypothetical protein
MKALVIVAHPDDHVLWMGGTILRLNQWEWHIISLCNSHRDESLETFRKSCENLGACRFIAKELSDYQPREVMETDHFLKMQKYILAFADKEYDLIFTHSIWPDCEYGFHANHFEARYSVNQLIYERLMKTKCVLYFCYKSGGAGQPVIGDTDRADYKVELVQKEINKKGELKSLFSWAEGDLRSLHLLGNSEPIIETFNFKKFTEIELPSDFIKIHKQDPTGMLC